MKKNLVPISVLLTFAAASISFAGDMNENEMFSSSGVITQAVSTAEQPAEKKTIGFSGQITSVMEGVGISTATENGLRSYIVSNSFIDVRMKNDIKAFANVETTYVSQSKTTTFDVRELFFDFNYQRRVYFRTGKQVLQWGRCNLWNPTDLINVEKKPFIRKIGYREGAYGLKLTAPLGEQKDIFGFLDTGNADTSDNLGGALKYEFLTGKTEMAFSGWAKSTYNPMFGYDFSTRAGYVDILGEFSVSRGENTSKIRVNRGLLDVYRDDTDWDPRASINFSKGFRLGNFNDRLTVSTEFYYNSLGYDENVFNDHTVYPLRTPIALANGTGGSTAVAAATKKDFLLASNLYDPNYLSRYYGAVFTSITRFIITDMTFNANYIRNFNDGSGIVSAGITYTNIYDFSAGCLVNAALGPENSEYTFPGYKYDIQLTLGITF
jgi:hypothetical protein